ncbi:hypothetical protein BC830DRAFT_152306 [Chytriomyces sp. MP71]|nr:hypothetical protein BC830DRAFT_152306 [Chytriomyces sp. MP71]
MIIGLRFLSEDDEILFVQHLDSAMKLHENYNPNRPTLPPLPRDPFTPPPTLFCKTVIKKSATKIRSLTIVSQYPWIGSFEPLVSLALHEFNESEKIEVITSLYANLNSADVSSLPRLSVSERTIMRCAYEPAEYFLSIFEAAADRGARRGGEMHDMLAEDWDGISFTASVRYSEQMQEVDLPVYLYPEEIGDFSLIKLITTFSALDAIHPPAFLDLRWRNNAPFLWHPHLDCGARTHPFVLLLNALVTEKRVLFLGSGRTGGEVAGYVHAAAAAAGGGGTVVPDVLERVASVVNVGDLIGLQRSARFIAGSTDPAVEQRTDLWDVLLDINSGKITVSPQINLSAEGMANPTVPAGDIEWMCQGYWIGDAEFVLELISAIQNETPELQVRQLVYDHLQRFLDVTAAFELETCNTTLLGHPPVPPAAYPGIESGGAFFRDDQAKSAELCMLRNRIEGFRLSRGYFRYTQTHNARLQKSYLGPSFPLRALMAEIHNPDRKYQPPTARLVQILFLIQDTVLPGPNGAQTELLAGLRTKGIAVFAAGMMHERWEVRRACTRILWRLDWHMVSVR